MYGGGAYRKNPSILLDQPGADLRWKRIVEASGTSMDDAKKFKQVGRQRAPSLPPFVTDSLAHSSGSVGCMCVMLVHAGVLEPSADDDAHVEPPLAEDRLRPQPRQGRTGRTRQHHDSLLTQSIHAWPGRQADPSSYNLAGSLCLMCLCVQIDENALQELDMANLAMMSQNRQVGGSTGTSSLAYSRQTHPHTRTDRMTCCLPCRRTDDRLQGNGRDRSGMEGLRVAT